MTGESVGSSQLEWAYIETSSIDKDKGKLLNRVGTKEYGWFLKNPLNFFKKYQNLVVLNAS